MIALGILCILLLAYMAWRERQWDSERERLLQRIQAPQIAVQRFAERPERGPVVPIPVDDDEAFQKHKERRLSGDHG